MHRKMKNWIIQYVIMIMDKVLLDNLSCNHAQIYHYVELLSNTFYITSQKIA